MALALLATAMLVSGGCGKQRNQTFRLDHLTSFDGSVVNAEGSGQLVVPENAREVYLGLSVQGKGKPTGDEMARTATNLAELRFTLEIFHEGSSNAVYRADVRVTNNYSYHYLWKPDYGVIMGGLEPFPSDWERTRGNVQASYPGGKESPAVHEGRLIPNERYQLRVVVVEPISLTNRLYLWLYTIGDIDPNSLRKL
jgi:hypothetical protein